MSMQNLQSFRKQVNNDAQLQAAVRDCVTDRPGALGDAALAALGKSRGYDFSAEDVRTALSASGDELTDFELEIVSGGVPCGTGGTSTGGWP